MATDLQDIIPEHKGSTVEKKITIADPVITEKTIYPAPPQSSDSKYKWSGKWPRQLRKKDE